MLVNVYFYRRATSARLPRTARHRTELRERGRKAKPKEAIMIIQHGGGTDLVLTERKRKRGRVNRMTALDPKRNAAEVITKVRPIRECRHLCLNPVPDL
jgi:hypothetical protein